MAECELCGLRKKTRVLNIEGTDTEVCFDCMPFEPAKEQQAIAKLKKPSAAGKLNLMPTFQLIDNFNIVIKKARESKALTQEQLASLLKEKYSFVRAIEKGNLKPDYKLALRIEKLLGVNIIKRETSSGQEPTENIKAEENTGKSEHPLTLGDLLKEALNKKVRK